MSGTLEIFRRLIRQQTNLVGQVVENLYGAVAGTLPALAETKASSWQKIVLQGTELRTLDEFYTLWSIDSERRHSLIPAVDGVILSTEANACLQLFRATINAPAPLAVQLTVDAGATSSSIAIYVDGVLQRKASDAVQLALALTGGDHVIEVLTVSQHVVIGAPATIQLLGDQELLLQPAFDTVTATWLDAAVGTPATKLIWNVDPHVGGYRLLRKQARFLGKIKNVSAADQSGIFGITLSGDQSASVNPGETLSALHEDMGTAITVGLYDSGSDETSFILRLTKGLSTSKSGVDAGWVGRTALAGSYVEIKRVHRTVGQGQVTVFDADVKAADAYEYALQSYGLFDETLLSKVSDPVLVRAGDITPPGPITFVAGYPKVVNSQAWVRFTTPADEDYDGVQVFYRKQYSGTVSSATAGSVTFNSSILTGVTMGLDKYYVVITSGPAQGAVKKVTSLTVNSVTLDANEQLSTLPVTGNTAVVFVDFNVVTDRGVASTVDELTFDAKKYGDGSYYFRTFDFGNNLQLEADGVLWTYVASTADTSTDRIMPSLVLAASEAGNVGTVSVTLVDPQNRVSGSGAGVRFTTITGRGSAVVGSIIAPGGTWQADVALTEETTSFVDVDLYGIDAAGATGQLLDHQRQAFGLGMVPISPEIGYSTDSSGNLLVTLTVDNDTATVKAVATKGMAPNNSQLNAATPISKAAGSTVIQVGTGSPQALLTGLNTGERYFITAQSYHVSGLASDISNISDIYVAGTNDATAQVSHVSTSVSDRNIVFRVKPNRHCAEFEVYVKEYSADPGADQAIDASYPTPFDAIVVGPDAARYRAQPEQNYDLSIPIAGGNNYVMLTIVPYDAIARQGPRLNKKAQGNGTAAPMAPTAASITSGPTQTTVNVSVTMPATVPQKIRIYKDNVLFREDVTTGATANTAFALAQITGLSPSTTYQFTFSGYNTTSGVESPTRAGPLAVTTIAPAGGNGQIPQPVLSASNIAYDSVAERWSFTVTPGANTPAGVVWHIDRHTASSPFTSFVERVNGASTTLTDNDPADTSGGTDYYFTAWGTLTGWTTSLRSNPTTAGTEVATGPIHKTGYGEPTAIPTIGSATNPSSHTVRLTWTNTDSVSNIYVALERFVSPNWEAAAEVGGIAPGTTTIDKGVIVIGVKYRGRVRYYNTARNGSFSAYAETIAAIT
jgi:hypothetical protein